jgi:hypothetical protein
MKAARWLFAAAFAVALASMAIGKDPLETAAPTGRPELDYLKAINRAGPPQDPQMLFLLMGQYANANRHGEGAEFLSARLEEFGPKLSPIQKSLYLTAIAALRAGHAD